MWRLRVDVENNRSLLNFNMEVCNCERSSLRCNILRLIVKTNGLTVLSNCHQIEVNVQWILDSEESMKTIVNLHEQPGKDDRSASSSSMAELNKKSHDLQNDEK
jgi:hypothetical protein